MIYEFPVSPSQGRLLVLEGMHPGTAQYNVAVGFSVDGLFDTRAFTCAMDALVARHESLRTVFRPGLAGAPVQVVSSSARAAVAVEHDVSAARAHDRMLAEAARPFDTATGPLLRATVYGVDDGSTRVLLVAHHLVCDGWSLEVMLNELSAALASYTAGATGPAWEPPEPALQYPDFAAWQRERLDSGGFTRAVAHWADDLRGAPTVTGLPADRPPLPLRTTDGGVESFVLPAEVRSRLEHVAREHGATPFTALFSAFAAFLGRLCGQDDLVVGVPVSGRDRPELQDMVGLLTNTLAVRTDLSGAPSFHELMARTRARLLAGRSYEDAPYEAVVDAVAPDRAPGRQPLVQAMFSYNDIAEPALTVPGAEVRRVPLALPVAKFDLLMYVERWGEDLLVQFTYSVDLLDAATVRRWADNFLTLLNGLLDEPDAAVADVPLLSDDERAGVLSAADRTGEAVLEPPVPDLVAARAAERPDAVAAVHGTTTLTYRELMERADALAARLRAAGVGLEVPVGLLLPRSVDVGVAALAVLRAGGVYVPLDPGNPRPRLAYMVAESATRLLLAAAETAEQAAELGVPVLRVDASHVVEPFEPTAVGPAHLAYILYTSGSTGTPKGVAVEHRALANLCQAVRPAFPVGPDDRVLQYVNIGFDVAVSDLFFPWTAGAELHVANPDERLGDDLLARLRDSRITYAFLPPAAAMSVSPPGDRLPELRTLAVGGEPCPAELVERWAAPERRIVNAYGPSEVTVYSTTADLEPGRPVVLGRPVAGTRVMVLDARLRPAPVNVTGEIYVAGASLGRGYVGRATLTAERFVPDPYGPPGTRMYRSGDLGKRDADGVLHYLGRVDTQVKVRGFRIELGEIENLLSSHPEVAMAAAAVRGAADDRCLVAYVVGVNGARPAAAALRDHLAERLPRYMVPDRLVHLDALPLNRSGKIDRARLPEPPADRPEPEERYTEPATATERRIVAVWSRVLGQERIGTRDNFFDLGGNSVRMLAVLTALREEPVRSRTDGLKLVDLFRHPTVAALAAHLDGPGSPPGPNTPPEGETAAVAEAQQRGQGRRERLAARGSRTRNSKGSTR
ncbi:amino acid adenylation domain-containing protein [Streptomyces luteogriseus]|uniref:non-ribosomal peptide synthetase n=1 Tax=Streptomyces luteogriseus TaxID=68233 RepID=UPI0033FDE00B